MMRYFRVMIILFIAFNFIANFVVNAGNYSDTSINNDAKKELENITRSSVPYDEDSSGTFHKKESDTNMTQSPSNGDEFCPRTQCSNRNLTNLPPYRNIESCQCDEKCSDFKDCCNDSQYYDKDDQRKPSINVPIFTGTDFVLVKNKCASSHRDTEIIAKCALANKKQYLKSEDLQYKIMTTSLDTNITYANVYCAICNDEFNLITWTVYMSCMVPNEATLLCKTSSTCDGRNIFFDKINKSWTLIFQKWVIPCYSQFTPPSNIPVYKEIPFTRIRSCNSHHNGAEEKDKCEITPYSRIIAPCQRSKHNSTKFSYLTACLYENKYCAYCNDIDEKDFLCDISFEIYEKFKVQSMHAQEGREVSFPTIFDYKLKIRWKYCDANNKTLRSELIKRNMCHDEIETNSYLFTSTVVALSISLLCLMAHLLIFAVVVDLQTMLGKNVASFCVSLIMAYSSFLVGNLVGGTACSITGLIVYYSFLSAFFWMLSNSFDIWKTFYEGAKYGLKASRSDRIFFRYSCYSWGIPLIPTSVSAYFNWICPHSWLNPKFGDRRCWFQNTSSYLFFFVVPISFIILVNSLFFFHTSHTIRTNSSRFANQQISFVDHKTYARIALLTGFTWVIGFAVSYTENLVLEMIFVLLNTFQGVFIFAAFSCKKPIILKFLTRTGMFTKWQEMLKKSIDDKKAKTRNNRQLRERVEVEE